MNKLFTIGYEGADLNDFIETLKLVGVKTLLDVRELPISRRKGFSKNALKDALAAEGIAYQHERQLGSPKAMRHELRETWDYTKFFKAFDEHLDQQTELIEQLVEELSGHVALVCFEKNNQECHRTPVAARIADLTGIKPKHIGVKGHDQRKRVKNQGSDYCQGLSPA